MPIQPAQDLVVAGRFRLSRLIGRGGMGSVWLATHLGLDVPCAVKFIEGAGAESPEIHARFEREAKAAAQLRSPHVVQILDHGVWEGTPYIAMELLDGEDLGKRFARVGRMAPQEVIGIITQVCRALARAHAVGIVHRDLKPDNIFLVRDDDREIAKVLDFGIAKATGAGVGSSTRTGAMLGTPYYMSPEQAQGTRSVDARSDLWSLAVIVFELLTGHRPFESEALGDLLMRIIVAPIPMPRQVAPDLPPTFDVWWAKASQRDPAARFQSAKELCDALAQAFAPSAGRPMDAAQGPIGLPIGNASSPQFAQTPQPQAGAFTAAGVTRTFDGKAPGGKSRAGLFVGVGAGVVLLGAAAALGVSFLGRGSAETATHPPAAPTFGLGSAGGGVLGDAMGPAEHLAPTASSTPASPDLGPAGRANPAAPPPLVPPAPSPPQSPETGTPATASPQVGALTNPPAAPTAAPAFTAKPQRPATPPGVARPAAPPPPATPPPALKPPDTKKKPVDLGI
jgi:serine/threonine-protein kinase